MTEKKLNLADSTIQIRILKALEDIKPFGVFKHFHMVKVIRNLKQPNIIESKHIWQYLESEYDMKKYDERTNFVLISETKTFDQIFQE
ncbi:uncharacterized protein VICG_00548 [Vittaforma corneae ATCC 50505]|uniref:Uncharacterized protein n=1 Tax=Vittaforma corneae (strain ATCC 50505) TaxID=993615 RepID=L2GP91_VITCO|nr:uncharacterized protein VICG_00548 [Vittaforma corneae ATCC 50505]ELA42449.1 hypothetical protein VICG_00548 [Vittaforma corneae ATCC 50505]